MAIDLTGLSFFMPIVSFLLVFIVVYALLAKTEVLGENQFIHLFVSFLLAILFVVEVDLVNFVNFSSAWFVVFIVCVVLILALVGFTQGGLDFIQNKWIAWVMVAVLIGFFIISSAFTFNWAVNWVMVWDWFYTDWFSLVLLLIIAGVVAWVVAKK